MIGPIVITGEKRGVLVLENFVTYVLKLHRDNPEWREGQALFNALQEEHPSLAASVRGSLNDPYYDDSRIEAFWAYVETNWNR